MEKPLSRLELLFGEKALAALSDSTVFLCGTGGVGSWCAEALVRSGIGHLVMMDDDVVKPSNLNRQLCALTSSIGRQKVEVLAERLRDIAPAAEITPLCRHLTEADVPQFLSEGRFSCVIDAIDERGPKLALIAECVKQGVPVVSSMGAGNKTDAMQIRVADISKTYGCRLARLVRKILHKRGIDGGVSAVFSPEERPESAAFGEAEEDGGKRPIGTICHVTASFGMMCAQEAIRLITGGCNDAK